MIYIHQQTRWPAFTWNDSALSALLAQVRHRQGRLLGRMETLGFDLRQEASLTTLTTDVVKSSAIEGETLNRDEVRSSLARRLGLDAGGLPPVGRHVDGIVEMMLDATQNHRAALTFDRLFGWHATLFPTGRSGMKRITVGGWRTKASGPMQVVSGAYSRQRVHFEAPDADRLDAEMTAFLEWFNNGPVIDPVVKAGIAHLWFVTIHPFEDGNGRIARAIADLALARADNCAERFYSMSGQIEAERKAYYDELERQQKGDVDITGWLSWFLGCLDRALTTADGTLSAVLAKARLWEWISRGSVNDRQRIVINRLMDGFEGNLNNSKYAKLAKCSADTALRDIQALVERRVLVQNPGGGRSTSYRLATLDEINDRVTWMEL
ncbi:MAG: Fic family protein [Niveispirillum sp.]|uniref:Fic family protein n=1 Tax=Niveispirillum sp. TaxID=1917217 RepID=UPI003BA74D4F